MTTTKSVISNNISTTLSSIYTNSSGGNAVLKSLNIDGVADAMLPNPTFTSVTGADEWTHFGSAIMPLNIGASTNNTGFGIPIVVKLSADRLLLIWLPNGTHMGGTVDYMGGNTIHTQIVEYQSNPGRYVAGPIVNVILPTASFNANSYSLRSNPVNASAGGYGQPLMKGVALSATKVVIAYRLGSAFRIMRLNIVGNAVDLSTIANLDLTGASYFNTTTDYAFDINHVPGSSTKVLVGGASAVNWSIQAYNIPDTGALSSATSLVSIGVAISAYPFAFGNIVRDASANLTYYTVAATTAATTGSLINMSYNSSTDSLTTSGAAQAITVSTGWAGIEVQSLSTGTNINGVVAVTDSGATSSIAFYRQNSSSAATAALTSTLTLQSSVARSLQSSYNWGDERVIFSGDSMHVVYDSAGTSTNLIPTTLSTDTSRYHSVIYPFDSRPLYNAFDPNTVRTQAVTQLYARVGMTTSTDVGSLEFNANYMPWGHDYGNNYQWSTPANCWVVASYDKIYTLDTNGVVLDEVSLYQLNSTFNAYYSCKYLTVTPSGKIIMVLDYLIGTHGGGGTGYQMTSLWSALSAGNVYGASTIPLTSPYMLSKISLASTPVILANSNAFLPCCLTSFVDYSGTERAVALMISVVATPATHIHTWADNSWAATGSFYITSVGTTTAGAWNTGWKPQLRIIQDTPCSSAYPFGLWRIVGSQGTNTLANYRSLGASAPLPFGSFTSLNTGTNALTSNIPTGYAISFRQSDNIQVAAVYDNSIFNARIWASVRGRLTYAAQGWYNTANNINLAYVSAQTTKFNYSVAMNNVTGNTGNGRAYVFSEANVNAPIANVSTAAANSHGVFTHDVQNRLTVALFSNTATTNTRNTWTTVGVTDYSRVYVAIVDVANNNVFYVNNGQYLSSNGYFRSTDTYLIPNGYSLQLRSEVANSFTAMATVVEEI